MGGTFPDRCRSAVRPLLLAALLTGTWLTLAAGPASAAAEDPNPLGTIGQAAGSLLKETDSLLEETVPDIFPEPGIAPVQAIQDIPVPVVAVPLPVSGTAATVVDVVDPVPGGTTGVVTDVVDSAAPPLTDTLTDAPLVDTVTDAPLVDTLTDAPLVDTVTDTVAGTVDEVASVVDSLAPALPVIHVPELPVPTVPEPVPAPPVTAVPLPLPLPLPDVAVPGLPAVDELPAVPAAGSDTNAGDARPAESTGAPRQVGRPLSLLQFLANTQAIRALAATIGYVVSAAPAPANEPEAALQFAGLQNQSGSASAGAGAGGAEASGDVDGFWNPLHDAGRCLVPDAALILAASPSYDPGSSPD